MGKLFGKNPIQQVRVNDCEVIYRDAQREEREAEAKRIASNFNPDIFGVITVTKKNGINRHHVIDGQTRIMALKRMGYGDQLVPAVVKDIHDAQSAAKLFDGLNSGVTPSAIDKFRVRVTAGERAENEVSDIVRAVGYRVASNAAPGVISAVSSLMIVHRRHGPGVLRTALETIHATWKMDRDAVNGSIIQGYAALIAEHGKALDSKRLVDKIGKKFTAANLLAAAKGNRNAMGGTMPFNVLFVVALAYNHGIRTGSRIELDV